MTDTDTLFAPASGFGRAAVAVLRISGPAAGDVVMALAGTLPPPRRLSLRMLRDPADGVELDRALVAWFPGPGTYTGEDMAELHLHGGSAVRMGVLAALARLPGCRAAGPGAFTRRAVLNGRMDLAEAEAVADLIDAETEGQRRQALRQLDGALSRQVAAWRAEAIDCLAAAEAALDFADEGDVDDAGLDAALFGRAAALRDAIVAALRDGRRGERLRDGFTVVLAGAPNAGKSTLLNALSRREVAIVSDVPGTTRDAIEVRLDLGGLPVLLVDTAGLRDTAEPVEAEGIARTRQRIAGADLVLLLVPPDGTPPDVDTGEVPAVPILTKADLFAGSHHAGLAVSARTGAGLETLLDTIQTAAETGLGAGDALITRARHRAALEACVVHLDRLQAGAGGLPELAAEDLRMAVRALGEVGGHVGVEDVLDRLFAGFCIGK
ncbi:tRNA modification GTPase MnmE [Methylobacterium tardum]|uniref:tRNA modification GTPase MnmE n=1 Tax=Methylobacterium tardum TaxID=374432 RepID=A0AA37TIX9_9HYPH|nr:tRNA uridine-5-carboxymethylaminomethyl(34) synthesis GTPase MnmE [Methylobacterium tardum]URD35753.1 tRNA uridine-5-carboxymethylaminomethyl(34) synthesis GTPase MnmE [Methylobacterium tardum]GJE49505.1 tRNA modification GTPase MnmE [Methylobacterium tardum]GLS68793.1 tRNA modification GTPase MnmE [Methylobacterium tardum]